MDGLVEFARTSVHAALNDYDDAGQAPLHVAADAGLTEAISILTGARPRPRGGTSARLPAAARARARARPTGWRAPRSGRPRGSPLRRLPAPHPPLSARRARRAGSGADIDMPREEDNRTPLHIAVNEGHAEAVTALLEAGAKVRVASCGRRGAVAARDMRNSSCGFQQSETDGQHRRLVSCVCLNSLPPLLSRCLTHHHAIPGHTAMTGQRQGL